MLHTPLNKKLIEKRTGTGKKSEIYFDCDRNRNFLNKQTLSHYIASLIAIVKKYNYNFSFIL